MNKKPIEEIIMPRVGDKTPMDRLLMALEKEVPGYHTDKGQMAQAGYAIGTLAGSVAAWIMFRSTDPEGSRKKFLRLIETAALDISDKGYPLIKARIEKHGFQQEPLKEKKQ